MAKLTKDKAKMAEDKKDDVPDFGVVPPGIYLCKLTNVDTSRSGPAGPYWVWEYTTVGVGDEPASKKFWDNTSLSEKSIGRVAKVFEAFGTDSRADTDDLIGDLIAIEVKIGTINAGDNAGQKRNEVVAVHPAESHGMFDDYEPSTPSESASSSDLD
jgi:hypothetical protein